MVKFFMILGLLYMGYRLVKPKKIGRGENMVDYNEETEDVDYEELD